MTKFILGLSLLFCFENVTNGQILTKKPIETASNFVEQVQKAHNVARVYERDAIACDISIMTNGKAITVTLTTKTNSGKMRLQYPDGKTVVYDGKKIWLNGGDATDYRQARFDIFTWQYFFMAPFKMDDAGTNWQLLSDKTLDNNEYARAKLTFKQGTGDTPNDWFIMHRNKATDFLEAMAYIVTFGNKSVLEAGKSPNGITYNDFIAVDGVQFATTWQFGKWSEQRGFYDNKGGAKIKNIRFIKSTTDTFAPPLGSKEIVL